VARRYHTRYRTRYRAEWRGQLDDDGGRYTRDQVEFMMAMDRYKRENGRPFPTWCEVLAVLEKLGYHKGTRFRRPYER
jgi:hypothetical protein